jgi:hypothetical protein
MSNDAIGGWFLNIGNRKNLSTPKDESLHVWILSIGHANNLLTWKDEPLLAKMKK